MHGKRVGNPDDMPTTESKARHDHSPGVLVRTVSAERQNGRFWCHEGNAARSNQM